MRALKMAVVVMGVLIVIGTAALVVAVLRRPAGLAGGLPPVIEAVLQEPAGTRIGGIATVQDRLAVWLSGGGPDRVVLIDPRSGAVTGRVGLAH